MRWYSAATHPNKERFAAQQLLNQGYYVFLPTLRRRVRHARQVKDVLKAYFPGYLFVALDPDRKPWRSVNGTFGVRHLVGAGERPSPLPESFVEGLQGFADRDGIIQFDEQLQAGDRVRIMHGPFADFVGRVSQLSGPERVRVLLDLMQNGALIELPAVDCQKAS